MVIWTGPGRKWTAIGMAVPCPTCNVEIGQPCDWRTFKRGGGNYDRGLETHAPRHDMAEVFGFRCVVVEPGPSPPIPAPATPQGALF
jgi:hypothetical protein